MKLNSTRLLSLPVVLAATAWTVHGQDATSSGGDAIGTGGSASYSVGQVAYTATQNAGGSANQGVQQAYELVSVTNSDGPVALVFPNPTSSVITVRTESWDEVPLLLHVFDNNGAFLFAEQLTARDTPVDLGQLASGPYLLKVFGSGKEIQGFQIIKN